jgi:GNAT superfamily N-acetyltransferase
MEILGKIGGQPLSDSYGRAQCKYFARLIGKASVHKDELGTANGLTLLHFKDGMDQIFALFDGAAVVAYGKLEHSVFDESRYCMYNLYVDHAYRGKKLATVLHLGALHVYKKLMSDTCMALGALNAFRSLEKYGYKLKMLDTKTDKTVPFKWGADGIPVVNGKSIEDSENYALYI